MGVRGSEIPCALCESGGDILVEGIMCNNCIIIPKAYELGKYPEHTSGAPRYNSAL